MKRIVILGGGESGVGAAVLAKMQNFDVFLSDMGSIKEQYRKLLIQYNIAFEENKHSRELLLNATEVIKSPGIPDNAALVIEIREKGIPIISEIEFAARYTSAKMICITGSNGKTTTSMLLYHILKGAGLNVGLAGNVGNSLAMQVALNNFDYYVLELSSFQLDDMIQFKADVAILMNITPDHLDRYDNIFQNYIDSKFRILRNQTLSDYFIYCKDDSVIQANIAKHSIKAKQLAFSDKKDEESKAYIENEQLVILLNNEQLKMDIKELALKGRHNQYNSMAAGLAASIMNVRKENIRQSLSNFEGVEHRLEYVATVRDVVYINDSKATNVNSCWYALESINTPITLIMGGTDKGNDYTEIEELVKNKVNNLIFMGLDNSKLWAFFDGKVANIIEVKSMKDAVSQAYNFAKPGETVLLSPSCASFDLFQNYEERGVLFKQHVRSL